ncbi:MAG: hypothetical protein OEM96_03925 [Gemmatimonadota bacterium]|nr:hypothetical protein [Gemmatimonadota bacterium]
MRIVRESRFLRPVLTPLLLTMWISACHKWVPLEPPYESTIVNDRPDQIRVALADGTRTELSRPVVRGTSVVGLDKENEPITAVEFSEISGIEFRRGDTAGTVAVTVLGAAVGLAILIAVEVAGTAAGFD